MLSVCIVTQVPFDPSVESADASTRNVEVAAPERVAQKKEKNALEILAAEENAISIPENVLELVISSRCCAS